MIILLGHICEGKVRESNFTFRYSNVYENESLDHKDGDHFFNQQSTLHVMKT